MDTMSLTVLAGGRNANTVMSPQDQFDTIDFTENEIRKLDGFPLLKRLKCLMMNNNRIV